MSTVLDADLITSHLYSARLLTDEDKDAVSVEGYTPKKRMEELLDCIRRRIQTDTKNLHKFLLIICNVETYKALAKKICPRIS